MNWEVVKNIEVGKTMRFADLFDRGDEEEILESGSIYIGHDGNGLPMVADFEIVEQAEEIMETLVKITDIY